MFICRSTKIKIGIQVKVKVYSSHCDLGHLELIEHSALKLVKECQEHEIDSGIAKLVNVIITRLTFI